MSHRTEAFARVKIDDLLKDAGWKLTDGSSVVFEQSLPDGTQADYVLCDRQGRPMAALDAKRSSTDPVTAQDQGRHYAEQLEVPFVFLSNGEEVWFLDRETDAHARRIAGFYSQDDLERRIATRRVRRDPGAVETDRRIVDRDYQIECIEALCGEVSLGRRNLLVEIATGTGKTRTAAAFVRRLFEAGAVTRVLFLVDRIALPGQAEDAFTDHLRDYPCHVLLPGRGFDRAKRITIATLQTMIAEYRNLSPGYFDLVITDECRRSIYGKWSGVLRHFDGIQLGLTGTPCTVEAGDLPDPEDGRFVRDTLRFFGLDAPTFRYTLREAIDGGHLVPYRIYKAMTVKTAADGGFEVGRDELDWSAMDQTTHDEFETLFETSGDSRRPREPLRATTNELGRASGHGSAGGRRRRTSDFGVERPGASRPARGRQFRLETDSGARDTRLRDLTNVIDASSQFGRAEPSRAEPSRAEPSRAEPSRAEPSRAEPSRAEPSRAEPRRAEPSRWFSSAEATARFPRANVSADGAVMRHAYARADDHSLDHPAFPTHDTPTAAQLDPRAADGSEDLTSSLRQWAFGLAKGPILNGESCRGPVTPSEVMQQIPVPDFQRRVLESVSAFPSMSIRRCALGAGNIP